MALPVNYDTVPVRGRYVYLDGAPAQGQIRFTGKVLATSDATDTIIVPTTITATLDENGYFQVNIPATDDPDILPGGWTYTVQEALISGGGRTFELDVPLAAKVEGIDLSDVAPATPASGDPTAFVTLSSFAAHTHAVSSVPSYAPRTSLRTLPTETVISGFQAGHGWTRTSASGTVVDDATTFARGTQSFKMTTPNSAANAVFADLAGTWNLTGKQFKLYMRVSDYTKLTELWVYFGNSDMTSYYRFNLTYDPRTFRTGDWCVVTLNPASATVVGTPSWSTIQKVRLRAKDAATGTVDVWWGGLSHFDQPAQGVVSITFDDSYASDYTKARPIMDAYGYRGVSYTIAGNIGQANRLTLAQAQALQNLHGWDLAAHGSPDLTTLTATQLRAEFATIKKFLYENGLAKGADHYAFPMGRYNPLVQSISKEYFASTRTIDEYTETTIPGDPYRLRILNVTNNTTASAVATAVQAAVANKAWLILVYHQIVDTNADVDTKVLTASFQQHMADIAAAGAVVKTVSEVIAG